MSKSVTAIIPFTGNDFSRQTVQQLLKTGLVEKVYLLTTTGMNPNIEGAEFVAVDGLYASATINLINKVSTPFTLCLIHDTPIELGQFGVNRLVQVADATGSTLVYSDYYDMKGGKRTPHPVTDYQLGSV